MKLILVLNLMNSILVYIFKRRKDKKKIITILYPDQTVKYRPKLFMEQAGSNTNSNGLCEVLGRAEPTLLASLFSTIF